MYNDNQITRFNWIVDQHNSFCRDLQISNENSENTGKYINRMFLALGIIFFVIAASVISAVAGALTQNILLPALGIIGLIASHGAIKIIEKKQRKIKKELGKTVDFINNLNQFYDISLGGKPLGESTLGQYAYTTICRKDIF